MAKKRTTSEKRKLRMAAAHERGKDRKANNVIENNLREERNRRLTAGRKFATKTARRKFLDEVKNNLN